MAKSYIDYDIDMDDNHPLVQIVGPYFFHNHLNSKPTDYSMFINATGELDVRFREMYGHDYKNDFLNRSDEENKKSYFIYHGDVEADNILNVLDFFKTITTISLGNIAGIVVVGNISVNGTLQHVKSDVGLYVLGNLHVKNIIIRNDLVVKGNVKVENILFGFYNDGYLQVNGGLDAHLIVSDDYTINANTITGNSVHLRRDESATIKKHINKSFLTFEGDEMVLQTDKYINFILNA